MAKTISTKTVMEDQVVKIGDLVEVTSTGTSPHMPKGAVYTVHRIHAKTLADQGHVEIGESKPKKSRIDGVKNDEM